MNAHAARGVFIDLKVNAAAPQYLIASGFGDSICRPTAQVDWYFAHRLFGTPYLEAPYALQAEDEKALFARSSRLGQREIEAVGYLHRLLTLCGFGLSVAGMSHPGSMGEHQISHWIDSFAGKRHPGTVHGQQVGVTSVTMARLQEEYVASGRAKLFEYLQGCLGREESALPYAEIAARLNLTEPAVKMAVHRLRARYREILRAEIAHTVSSPEEVEEEIRLLFSAFGS